MKTVAIAVIFGLCTLIGMRIAAKKTERLRTVLALEKELRLFSERIASGNATLTDAAGEDGILSGILTAYRDTLSAGGTERDAAEKAAEGMFATTPEREGAKAFLTGISGATRADIRNRTEQWLQTLTQAEREAEAETKKARVIRVSGALIGAGIAILLL